MACREQREPSIFGWKAVTCIGLARRHVFAHWPHAMFDPAWRGATSTHAGPGYGATCSPEQARPLPGPVGPSQAARWTESASGESPAWRAPFQHRPKCTSGSPGSVGAPGSWGVRRAIRDKASTAFMRQRRRFCNTMCSDNATSHFTGAARGFPAILQGHGIADWEPPAGTGDAAAARLRQTKLGWAGPGPWQCAPRALRAPAEKRSPGQTEQREGGAHPGCKTFASGGA